MAKDLKSSIEVCAFKPLSATLFSLHAQVFSKCTKHKFMLLYMFFIDDTHVDFEA